MTGSILTWVRRLVIVTVVVLAALIVRRYDFERLPKTCADLGDLVRPESLLVLTKIDGDSSLGAGTLVEAFGRFETEGKKLEGSFLSRIRGVPGDRITFARVPGSRDYEIHLNGEHTWAFANESSPLTEGIIPKGQFLLIDPAPQHGGVDSRRVGLVPRKDLHRKIIAHW